MSKRRRNQRKVTEVEDVALECRTFGHMWEYRYTKARVWEIQLRCERCDCLRFDMLDAGGRVMKRWYKYPEGYLGVERTVAAELRLEIKRRLRKSGVKGGRL